MKLTLYKLSHSQCKYVQVAFAPNPGTTSVVEHLR